MLIKLGQASRDSWIDRWSSLMRKYFVHISFAYRLKMRGHPSAIYTRLGRFFLVYRIAGWQVDSVQQFLATSGKIY